MSLRLCLFNPTSGETQHFTRDELTIAYFDEPAALGSAILYGPNVGRYLEVYSRFANAGAARIVKDSDTLASAVQQCLAPDQAALMAAAGWNVASSGAEVTDKVIELVHDTLDALGAE